MKKINKFQLTIPNQKGNSLIFSIPQNNSYQIIKNVKLNLSAYSTIKSNNNKIIYFQNQNKNNQTVISFKHQPLSHRQNIDESFSLKDYPKKPIKSDCFINGGDKKIMELQKKIIGKETNLGKIINNIYQFTLEYLNYGNPIPGLYPYEQALIKKTTDCGGFSTFILSLFQSLSIPGRLIVGYIVKDSLITKLSSYINLFSLNFNSLLMHAWPEIILPDNSWLPMDPSIEWRRINRQTTRKGGLGFIPDDRLVVSYNHNIKIKINNKRFSFDIIQHPIFI